MTVFHDFRMKRWLGKLKLFTDQTKKLEKSNFTEIKNNIIYVKIVKSNLVLTNGNLRRNSTN